MNTVVAIHGASGRLGQLIAAEAGDTFTGPVPRRGDIPVCDVVIDVTSGPGLTQLLSRLTGQPLLIGTTGDLPTEAIEAYALIAPVAIVPNFSAGVPLLLKLIQQAIDQMPEDWAVEIVEAHHDQKLDAPSGTAKRMQRAVAEAGDVFVEQPLAMGRKRNALETGIGEVAQSAFQQMVDGQLDDSFVIDQDTVIHLAEFTVAKIDQGHTEFDQLPGKQRRCDPRDYAVGAPVFQPGGGRIVVGPLFVVKDPGAEGPRIGGDSLLQPAAEAVGGLDQQRDS